MKRRGIIAGLLAVVAYSQTKFDVVPANTSTVLLLDMGTADIGLAIRYRGRYVEFTPDEIMDILTEERDET